MNTQSDHWKAVHERRAPAEVSWFQKEATASLEMIAATGVPLSAPVLDVGAGSSTLVDDLRSRGYSDITLLDIAEAAFTETRRRNQTLSAGSIQYVVCDIRQWIPPRQFALWHDRAAFHFLTAEDDRAAYRRVLATALAPRAHAIIATFAEDGPETCSGLPVRRYSAALLVAEFEGLLAPVESRAVSHTTPAGWNPAVRFRTLRTH